jgi:hypothetical protein
MTYSTGLIASLRSLASKLVIFPACLAIAGRYAKELGPQARPVTELIA